MTARCILATAALAVALAGGCGGEGVDSQEQAQWGGISRTLTPGLDSASDNVCNRGDLECVDAVITEMANRFDPLARRCDHKSAFAFMYLRVTEAVRKRAGEDFFSDPAFLNHLDAIFARLYFDAFDAWQAGRPIGVPGAWRTAFAAADGRRVSGIGDMLLGMNAHISRDLPFALASIGLSSAGGATAKPDFERVNEILAQAQGSMLAEAARRFDATIGAFSLPALAVDEASVALLLGSWRDEAWRNAQQLLAAATAEERSSVAASIEAAASARALLILGATSYVPFLTSTDERDAYCPRQRSGG